MPKPPLPAELVEFLAQPNPSVIATLGPDGSPHTAATWYRWENGRVLVNMDESRKRLGYMRRNPLVSMTILGKDDWSQHVTLRGRVVEIADDPELETIDWLSRHYTGQPHSHRDGNRVNAWIEIVSWYAWAAGRAWTGSN